MCLSPPLPPPPSQGEKKRVRNPVGVLARLGVLSLRDRTAGISRAAEWVEVHQEYNHEWMRIYRNVRHEKKTHRSDCAQPISPA